MIKPHYSVDHMHPYSEVMSHNHNELSIKSSQLTPRLTPRGTLINLAECASSFIMGEVGSDDMVGS